MRTAKLLEDVAGILDIWIGKCIASNFCSRRAVGGDRLTHI